MNELDPLFCVGNLRCLESSKIPNVLRLEILQCYLGTRVHPAACRCELVVREADRVVQGLRRGVSLLLVASLAAQLGNIFPSWLASRGYRGYRIAISRASFDESIAFPRRAALIE